MNRPHTNLVALLFFVLQFATLFPKEHQPPVLWVWSGAVTTNSAVVKTKVRPEIDSVRLLLTVDADWTKARSEPASGFASPDEAGVVSFRLSDLEPNTTYSYAVEVQGQRTLAGKFRTFADGPMSFRIAFASCAATGSNHRVFDTIRKLEPLFFLHLGDFHYEDIKKNDPKSFRRAYDRVLTAPRQAALYRSTPISYVWDDHDFGPNNSNRNAPGKPAALSTYQQYVPHYPLERVNGEVRTIQQAFTVGRVRFIMTDSRAERSPAKKPEGPDKTMLGTAQAKWLEHQFIEAADRYPLVVWVNVVPWITKENEKSGHGWSRYQRERTQFADIIKGLNLNQRLVILSGDGHMLAMDDGTNSNYASDRKPGERGFPVIQAAPLDRQSSTKGGPYSHGVVAAKGPARVFRQQRFAVMDLKDDGGGLEVTFTGHNPDGPIPGMQLTIRCKDSTCLPK